VGRWIDLRIERSENMEVFEIFGFILGLGAIRKIVIMEKQLKESGILKEQAESGNK